MIVVISPAKTLDFETPVPVKKCTKPQFLSDADNLVKQLKKLNASQISKLMSISPKLGELNYTRYRKWAGSATASKQACARAAIFAFKGDVYTGLDATSLKPADLEFAQEHLRMLSGLYGVLRPFDVMQAYRLEMGTAFKNDRGGNLYQYWDDRITDSLNKDLKRATKKTTKSEPVLINLASQEYFGAVDTDKLKARVVTPVFKEWRSGKLKFISFNAKKARGVMSRYLIQKRLDNPEDLKKFDVDGYRYDAGGSNDNEWLFARA